MRTTSFSAWKKKWFKGVAVGVSLIQDHCARAVDHLEQEILLLSASGRIIFANRNARSGLGEIGDDTRFVDHFFSKDGDLPAKLRMIGQSNQWLPFNATIAAGPMQGVELRFRGRGVRNVDTEAVELLLVADRHRDDGFRQLRTLIRELNGELAAKREANERLQGSLEAETRLHRELIHRVKNNLALLNALVSFRRRGSDNAEVQEALKDLEMRIHAIRAVHDLLDQAGEIDYVQAGELINALCNQLRKSVLPERVEIENELLDVTLHVHQATPLSLLVNELITNAAKHAFPEGQSGTVTVSLQKNGVDKLEVSVADDGIGYAANPERTGTGTRITEALAKQIGGTLERKSSRKGTTWTFEFPHESQK